MYNFYFSFSSSFFYIRTMPQKTTCHKKNGTAIGVIISLRITPSIVLFTKGLAYNISINIVHINLNKSKPGYILFS